MLYKDKKNFHLKFPSLKRFLKDAVHIWEFLETELFQNLMGPIRYKEKAKEFEKEKKFAIRQINLWLITIIFLSFCSIRSKHKNF